jgi:GNAT superfamily N-acetyltransferase
MKTSAASIRTAESKDLAKLFELFEDKARFDGNIDFLVATKEEFAAAVFGESPGCEVLVVDLHGELLGFVTFFPTFSTYLARPGLWMEDLYVKSEVRGRGLGRLLLQALSRIAVDRGCARIEWTVATTNARGISFYEREGARLLHDHRVARMEGDVFSNLAGE